MIDKYRAKKYCSDDISKIENYDKAIADTTQTWICHHRLGLVHSSKELERLGLYENRPADELIFVTHSEHNRLHSKPLSDETKRKLSEAHKGERNPMYGKPRSDETKQKIADALKGEKNPNYGKTPSDETRRKIAEANKGKPSPMKGKTMSDEAKQKIAEAKKAYWARRKTTNK